MLTLFACGVAVISQGDLLITSFTFGITLLIAIYTFGSISEGHFNPVVSFAMYLIKKIKLKDFIFYVIAQIIGALIGSLLLGVLLGSNFSLGANGYGEYYLADTMWIALIVEIILTFIFLLIILIVTNKKEYYNYNGLLIGLALILVHLFGIRFTGTGVNPARSLAPAILQGVNALSQVWVFIVGPLIGSLIATFIYTGLFEPKN